ncbi:diacylglycerol kinase [Thalassomonas sp. M1454]|uniref:diacylglycerol kinase n=1 Tax=Thalassomonas sp. M1454 TaxID=2594477 RepID=UPI00117BE74F|nr:diacylglycerol kinase [Thalassomonas sp. M1454]TRX56355.1 diacylglycerol kinase [Thalassomonas sp. M1454]
MSKQQATTNKPNGAGLARLFKATRCSMQGFAAAWQHEAAFRQELLLTSILFPFSFFLASSINHWLILFFSLLFLLFAEIVNSALEALADKVCLDHDVLIGRAKDLGSSLVFIALVFMKVVWLLAILQYFNLISS